MPAIQAERTAKRVDRAEGQDVGPAGCADPLCGYNRSVNVAIDTVGVRELKDNLSRYLAMVRDGGEVVVTEHGRPVARVISIQGRSSAERLAELVAAGQMTPARTRRRAAPRPVKLPRGAGVSDLVKDQRR